MAFDSFKIFRAGYSCLIFYKELLSVAFSLFFSGPVLDKDPYETTNIINVSDEKYIGMKLKAMVEDFLSKYEPLSIPYPKQVH